MGNEPVLEFELKKCLFCGEAAEVRATNSFAMACCPNDSCPVQSSTSLFRSIRVAICHWNERKGDTEC